MTTALENERHEVLRGVPPRRVRLLLVVDVFRTYTHAHILSRRNQENPKTPDGRHPRQAHIHTFSHLHGPERLVRTYANKRKNGKSMMMKLEDIIEVPAVGPSHQRGATKCTVKIR